MNSRPNILVQNLDRIFESKCSAGDYAPRLGQETSKIWLVKSTDLTSECNFSFFINIILSTASMTAPEGLMEKFDPLLKNSNE